MGAPGNPSPIEWALRANPSPVRSAQVTRLRLNEGPQPSKLGRIPPFEGCPRLVDLARQFRLAQFPQVLAHGRHLGGDPIEGSHVRGVQCREDSIEGAGHARGNLAVDRGRTLIGRLGSVIVSAA